jgi:hypothetical protein
MNDTTLFAFEEDFVATLRCIPMAVRFKLDACGIKVSLRQWSRFSRDERRDLLMRPCAGAIETVDYREALTRLIRERTGDEAKPVPPDSTVPWDDAGATPTPIRAFAQTARVRAPSDTEWRDLTPLQRFVLLKLSRDNHDNINFVPALREFGLRVGAPGEALS